MAPKATANLAAESEHFRLLFNTIKYALGGTRVNWDAVARDMGIANASAAQRRVKRLFDKYGEEMPKGTGIGLASTKHGGTSGGKGKGKVTAAKTGQKRKREVEDVGSESEGEDQAEDEEEIKPEAADDAV